MEHQNMIKPTDEIWFSYVYFNEICDFIKYGLPTKFEGLLSKYPKIKSYRENERNAQSKYRLEKRVTIGGNEVDYYNKIISSDSAGQDIYECSDPLPMHFVQWNEAYSNKRHRANKLEKDISKIATDPIDKQTVFLAISIFWKIRQGLGLDYGKVQPALDEALEILTLKKFVKATDSPGIIVQADSIFKLILSKFGLNDKSSNISFAQRIHDLCNQVCGKSGFEPYSNVKNALDLLRSMRNKLAHESCLIFGQKDEVTFAIYVCILVVYLCIKHSDKTITSQFSAYTLKCYIEGEVKQDDVVIQAHNSHCNEYELSPFVAYTVNGKPFELNLESYGASIGEDGTISCVQYQIGESITPEYNAWLAEQLKNKTNTDIHSIITLLSEKIEKQSEKLSEKQSEKLSEIQENVRKELDIIIRQGGNVTPAIQEKIKEQTKELEKLFRQQSVGWDEIKKMIKKMIYYFAGSIAVILFLIVGYYFWDNHYNTAELAYSRHNYRLAYEKGHPDAAYEYARQLEDAKKYEEAASWYRKAIASYENYFSTHDTIDLNRSRRLISLLIDVKGGDYDPDKIYRYAAQIKELPRAKGLYIFACLISGKEELVEDEWEHALHQGGVLQGTDDYLGLVAIYYYLTNHRLSVIKTENEFKKLKDKLAKKKKLLPLLNYTIFKSCLSGNTVFGVDPFTVGVQVLANNAVLYNHIPSQMTCSDLFTRLGMYEESDSLAKLALANGCKESLLYLLRNRLEMKNFQSADSLQAVINSLKQFEPTIKHFINSRGRSAKQQNAYLKNGLKLWDDNKVYIGFDLVNLMCMNYLKANQLDSIPFSNRNYLRAVQCFEGIGGYEKDSAKGDSLLELAVSADDLAAKYTKGILAFEKGNDLQALKMLTEIADTSSTAANVLSFLYEDIDVSRSKHYLELGRKDSDVYYVLKNVEKWETGLSLLNEKIPEEELSAYIANLEQALCRNIFSGDPNLIYLSSQLALLYGVAGHYEASHMHAKIAFAGSMKSLLTGKPIEMIRLHWCLLQLVELYLRKSARPGDVNMTRAQQYLEEFCLVHFMGNQYAESAIHRKLAIEAVRLIRNNFPAMEVELKQKIGSDFAAGITDKVLKECPKTFYYIRHLPNYEKYMFNLK